MTGRNNIRRRKRPFGPPRWRVSRRTQVCEESARIMAEQGIRDFQLAKTKAVERLGAEADFPLPTNREIERALEQRLRLFDAPRADTQRVALLSAAEEIMHLLDAFRPRLVGALIRGTVTERTPAELHVFTDVVEDILLALEDNGVKAISFEKRMRYAGKRYVNVPGFRFDVGEIPAEVLVFPENGIREAPLCPVTARPMKRTPLSKVPEL